MRFCARHTLRNWVVAARQPQVIKVTRYKCDDPGPVKITCDASYSMYLYSPTPLKSAAHLQDTQRGKMQSIALDVRLAGGTRFFDFHFPQMTVFDVMRFLQRSNFPRQRSYYSYRSRHCFGRHIGSTCASTLLVKQDYYLAYVWWCNAPTDMKNYTCIHINSRTATVDDWTDRSSGYCVHSILETSFFAFFLFSSQYYLYSWCIRYKYLDTHSVYIKIDWLCSYRYTGYWSLSPCIADLKRATSNWPT